MSFGYGLHFRDELEEPVAREFDALIARLKAFLEVSMNVDGTLKAAAIANTTATPTAADIAAEEHWWRNGPWTFDDPAASNPHIAGLFNGGVTAGTYNDYTPGGIDNAVIIEVSPDGGPVTFTGMKAPSPMRKRLVLFRNFNDDPTRTVTLSHQSTSSQPQNRFQLPGDVDIVLAGNQNVLLYYTPFFARWTAAVTPNSSGGIGTGSSSGDVLLATITLTEAQLEALSTTPIEVIPAAGANTIIVPIMHNIELSVTTGYSSSPTINCKYNGDATLLMTNLNPAWNNIARVYQKQSGSSLGSYVSTSFYPENTAVDVKASAAPSGAGSATAIYQILYYVSTVT